MQQYVIGIDFGTLSGRTILVNTATGEEAAESILEYPHGVMSETLPSGKPLPPLFALQHPGDYLDVLRVTIPDVLRKAGVPAESVAGVGVDFTSCTVLPTDADGTPLCFFPEYADEPHAYVKLWKHHAAQPYADEINALAAARGERWLALSGGKISSEAFFPKILQTLREAPGVYHRADRFLEAGDWIIRCLTGCDVRSASLAGYKACWNPRDGYPSDEFLTALDPALSGIVGSKISANVRGIGQPAGVLSRDGAALTGLLPGTPVALPQIDAHAAMPALNITGEGTLMMIVGTSACHIINGQGERAIPGFCGSVRDGVIPGFDTYEAGQASVGDIFDWFVKNGVPEACQTEARTRGIGIYQLLREKASRLRPGENHLLALDWLNGNRSDLVNANLSGMMLGITLQTKPEDLWRAWLESAAYGTRIIIERYEEAGVRIDSICAAGGIARKDELMMQIYADVTGREIRIAGSTQAAALGSAIYASVAGGVFPDLPSAAAALSKPDLRVYRPIPEHRQTYDRLYAEYKKLHDYFGTGENPVMETLQKE